MWLHRYNSKHGRLFRANGKAGTSSAVCATGMIPGILTNSGAVLSLRHFFFPFQLESILVIVPLGCLYKSLQILLRCPDQKHCLILFSCTKSLSSLELSVQRMNCTLICQLKQSHLNYFHISTLIQKLFILHKGSSRAFCTFIPTFFLCLMI